MTAFFIRKPKKIFVAFPEESESANEPRVRAEALDILAYLFETWQASWNGTKRVLGDLNLSESSLRRLNFYETEQKKAVITLLSKLLVAWEGKNPYELAKILPELAKELRPSLPYVEYDPKDHFILNSAQLALLRAYLHSEASALKESIHELEKLTPEIPASIEKPLTETTAETLLREKLGLTFFDFVEFSEEPDFKDGYYPELLQESAEFGF